MRAAKLPVRAQHTCVELQGSGPGSPLPAGSSIAEELSPKEGAWQRTWRGVRSQSSFCSVPPTTTVSAQEAHNLCVRARAQVLMESRQGTLLGLALPPKAGRNDSISAASVLQLLTCVGDDVTVPVRVGVVPHPGRAHPQHLAAHRVHGGVAKQLPSAQACRRRQGPELGSARGAQKGVAGRRAGGSTSSPTGTRRTQCRQASAAMPRAAADPGPHTPPTPCWHTKQVAHPRRATTTPAPSPRGRPGPHPGS